MILPALNKLPPHSYTILPPLAAQTLSSIYPLWTNYPLTLTPFNPPWLPKLFHQFTPSGKITPSLLHHFTPLGSPTLTWFYPLWTNYPLTLTPFYPPWQPNSLIILPPLDKLLPHSYTNLPPLAAQLFHHFTPSGQITPSLLHHFTPSEQITPSLLHHFTPLGSPTLISFYPLWTSIRGRGVIPENSSHCSPLQPTLKWQFFSGWGGGVIPERSSLCSPFLLGNFSQGGNSWKVLPLQSIAPHSYTAISVKS